MTRKNGLCPCKSMSDKDFIFDVFSDKGFVADASGFLKADKKIKPDQEAGGETEGNPESDDSSL